MTTTLPAIIVPIGEWFTSLRPDTRDKVLELVNNQGYPLDDIQEFIAEYGETALLNGYYETWCELDERGYGVDAVAAFVRVNTIDDIGDFEDAYVGSYSSEVDFAESHITSLYDDGPDGMFDKLMSEVVVNWQATWDTNLRHEYDYDNGHVFRSCWQ